MGKIKQRTIEEQDAGGLVVVVCGDADGNACLVTTPENLARMPAEQREDAETELYCIRGESWEDCMSEYYRLEGRGEYVPLDGPRAT
jgi:hypothetical protein